MSRKIQRNPSTGKISRNVNTGKIQVAVPLVLILEDCCQCFPEGTPIFYTVTIEGVTDCPGLDGSNVNGTWLLEIDPASCDFGGDMDCEWIYEEDVNVEGNVRVVLRFAEILEGFVGGFTSDGAIWRNAVGKQLISETDVCEFIIGNNVASTGTCRGPSRGTGGTLTWAPFGL